MYIYVYICICIYYVYIYTSISRLSSAEYAATFAIKISCGTQSKAFGKSIKTPTITLLLSKCYLHFSKCYLHVVFDVVLVNF